MPKWTPVQAINDCLSQFILNSSKSAALSCSIIVLIKYQCLLAIFFLHILEYGQSLLSIFFLQLLSELFVLHFFILYTLQPVVIMPNGDMIVRFKVHRLRLSHPDSSLQEVSLIVVINGSSGVFNFIELYECEPSLFFCHVVDGYLN